MHMILFVWGVTLPFRHLASIGEEFWVRLQMSITPEKGPHFRKPPFGFPSKRTRAAKREASRFLRAHETPRATARRLRRLRRLGWFEAGAAPAAGGGGVLFGPDGGPAPALRRAAGAGARWISFDSILVVFPLLITAPENKLAGGGRGVLGDPE